MPDAHEFLRSLATVLGVAAVTTVLFHRLRLPVVLGYILAGLIVGPHVPVPLVADPGTVTILSELGVILLMFSLGLEFSLRKLARVGPVAGVTVVIETSIMVWLGYATGRAFGWTPTESLFAGAIVAISSTTVIVKAFEERGIGGRLRDLVLGVLVVEDLIAILLMALLTAVASGDGLSADTVARSGGRLSLFLAASLAAGLLVVPRAFRAVARLGRPETTLVASMGLCFSFALLAQSLGYSVALGAFLAGSLVAESGVEKRVEHLVTPVRDMFAAIFFVSVGLMFDPAIFARHWPAVAALTALVMGGKIAGVSLGAFLAGSGTRNSVQAGMSLAQIGEFSFIIAGLGTALRATGDFLYPVAVAVSATTALTTPWLIRASGPVANLVDRRMPAPLQTFASLYGSWLERLREGPRGAVARGPVRRLAGLLLLDALCFGALVIGMAVSADSLVAFLSARLGLSGAAARTALVFAAAALAVPFVLGILGLARKLGSALAEGALPGAAEGKADLAAAPRRALVVGLQLALALLVGLPLVAATQPFLPGITGVLVLAIPLLLLGISFWRSAKELQGHVRAGSEAIVEALAAQAHGGAAPEVDIALDDVNRILPGLGEPVVVRLDASSPAVGRTLALLNLRGLTGATILAIRRGEAAVPFPSGGEVLRAGDLLALAGTQDAVTAATDLLRGPGRVAPS